MPDSNFKTQIQQQQDPQQVQQTVINADRRPNQANATAVEVQAEHVAAKLQHMIHHERGQAGPVTQAQANEAEMVKMELENDALSGTPPSEALLARVNNLRSAVQPEPHESRHKHNSVKLHNGKEYEVPGLSDASALVREGGVVKDFPGYGQLIAITSGEVKGNDGMVGPGVQKSQEVGIG